MEYCYEIKLFLKSTFTTLFIQTLMNYYLYAIEDVFRLEIERNFRDLVVYIKKPTIATMYHNSTIQLIKFSSCFLTSYIH